MSCSAPYVPQDKSDAKLKKDKTKDKPKEAAPAPEVRLCTLFVAVGLN
jgi:hypothetical protein